MIVEEDLSINHKHFILRSLDKVLSSKLTSSAAGYVISYNGQVIEASSLPGVIGSLCTISCHNGELLRVK